MSDIDFKLDWQFEMSRLTKLHGEMLSRATTTEIIRLVKLSTKLVENPDWKRWGKDNEYFLNEMEQKYCVKGDSYEEKS